MSIVNHRICGEDVIIVSDWRGVMIACSYGSRYADPRDKMIEVFSTNGKLSLIYRKGGTFEYCLRGDNPDKHELIPCSNNYDKCYVDYFDKCYKPAHKSFEELSEILQIKYDKIISHRYELVDEPLGGFIIPSVPIEGGLICINDIDYNVCANTLNIYKLGGKYLKNITARLIEQRNIFINERVDPRRPGSNTKAAV